MTIIGLQETLAKVKENKSLENLEHYLDETRKSDNKGWHPEDASIFDGLKPADRADVRDTLKAVSLQQLLEFAISGTAGMNYLIPDKVYDILYTAAKSSDIVPSVSPIVSCPGSSLKVDIEVAGQYKARFVAGGARMPDESMQITQATATPKLFSINTAITNELIEDSQFPLFETHLRRAAEEMGRFSTRMFITDLVACSDGDGTQNTWTTRVASLTEVADVFTGYFNNLADGWVSDTVIIGGGALKQIVNDASTTNYSDTLHTKFSLDSPIKGDNPMMFGQDLLGMNWYVVPETYTGTDGGLYLSSKWHTFVLNKANAMLTVRKRWLKIENYSDPVRDLVGAVVSARQDEVSVHNDSSCEITEL
jgi:hypothetical protein